MLKITRNTWQSELHGHVCSSPLVFVTEKTTSLPSSDGPKPAFCLCLALHSSSALPLLEHSVPITRREHQAAEQQNGERERRFLLFDEEKPRARVYQDYIGPIFLEFFFLLAKNLHTTSELGGSR